MELDDVDHRILGILTKDARTPFTEVSRALRISDATVHVRVKKMISGGIIKRYTVVVDEKALGRKVRGFVLLNAQPGSLMKVASQLVKVEGISAIYEIHGPNDLILKMEATNLDEIRDLMLKVREIPHVTTCELITILKVWKEKNGYDN